MIQPNFDLFLWLLLATFIIEAVARIIAGSIKLEKDTRYGTGDAIIGLIELFILAWVMLK